MLPLDPNNIDLAALRQLWQGADARLDDAAMQRVVECAESVGRIVASGETVYGVNTGFGLLANAAIPADRLAELQTNLILSHSAGLGEPFVRDARVSEQAEASVDAINGLAAGHDAIDRGRRFRHALHRSVIEPRFGAAPQLAQLAERDVFWIELHLATIGRSRPCSWAQSMAISYPASA